MLLESHGITIDNYYIPPFSVSSGEITVLFLYGGAHFPNMSEYLANICSGKSRRQQVIVSHPFKWVKTVRVSGIRSRLFPITVGEYIKKRSGLARTFTGNIYNQDYLNKNTHVHLLSPSQRKILHLNIALSHSKYVVFDMSEIDPVGAGHVLQILQENSDNGGAAIIIDNSPEFRSRCNKFIELHVIHQQLQIEQKT